MEIVEHVCLLVTLFLSTRLIIFYIVGLNSYIGGRSCMHAQSRGEKVLDSKGLGTSVKSGGGLCRHKPLGWIRFVT